MSGTQEVRFNMDGANVEGGEPGESWQAIYQVPYWLKLEGMPVSEAASHDPNPRYVRVVNLWDLDVADSVLQMMEDYPNATKDQPEYAVLRASEQGAMLNEVTFTPWLKKAHSDADWAATGGKWAIVVERPSYRVVYDSAEDN